MENSVQQIARRASVIARHFMVLEDNKQGSWSLEKSPCLQYSSPESASEEPAFDIKAMRCILDGHNVEERDWLFHLMAHSDPFCPRNRGGKVHVMPDYNQPMEHQRDMTMKRIYYLLEKGVFKGWLTDNNSESNAYKFLALNECLSVYDHSLAIKIGVHMHLWGGAIRFLGTERHHKKWLESTEDFSIRGCFAMTELGHGSNVRGIETCATYDPATKEFIINTPCESAQKYWIGGAANHATHTIVFSQLIVQGKNEGVHAFIVQIRDLQGNICPGVKIADCGHKIGLNGVDNGRIWFDRVRIPRENLLNSVADVSPSGEYQSPIGDPDKRFAAFMAPLTFGRVTIATAAIYESKVGLAIAIRYALSRRAFQLRPNEPEVLLLDYPAHQRRLLPLLAKTYAMSCAGNDLKGIYVKRTASDNKTLHVLSSGYKAMLTWHNMRTLQECREACGGQGLKTENRIGHLKGEFDVQLTFEGDNNVLMQQVSKALLGEYFTSKKKQIPLKSLSLEHMNNACPFIPNVLDSLILRSTKFQVDVFCLRERVLLEHLASEISMLVSQGNSEAVAFNKGHALAEVVGRAYSERRILDSFISAEKSVSDDSLKNILGLLRTLYSLVTIEEDISFLRYGILSPQQSQLVQREVSNLCSEVRPHALALVDSLGIPQEYLSPLAFDWVKANSWDEAKQSS